METPTDSARGLRSVVPRLLGRANLSPDAAGERFYATVARLIGDRDWALVLWDGRRYGAASPTFTLTIRDRRGLDQLIGSLSTRGFGRAYASGSIEVEPLSAFLSTFSTMVPRRMITAAPVLLRSALALGVRPERAPVAAVEARLHGRRHSRQRDAEAIAHHYDLPPAFYRLFLDDTLTYSCAYFEQPDMSLDEAQEAKLEYVCRKLRLRAGECLLDIGCGWGSLALHAARNHGVRVVGITLSAAQAEFAMQRVVDEGLAGQVEIRIADYRDPIAEHFDAIASIGMIEHVGREKMRDFGRSVHELLRPGGRALIHGITLSPRLRWSRASFTQAFVFPDGELEDIGFVDSSLELAGLELRDVESLREHYARTLRMWVERLERNWEEAVRIAGPERARIWRLYMSGSQLAFGAGSVSIHQSLVVRPDSDGRSELPLTRADWYRATGTTAHGRSQRRTLAATPAVTETVGRRIDRP
ncbi:MAG: class I SAM-dependent methyltransferase [Candidatus Dormibacteria bacterium]